MIPARVTALPFAAAVSAKVALAAVVTGSTDSPATMPVSCSPVSTAVAVSVPS